MSKKSIEEAAANLADPNICKTDNWIAGAEWQAERMYSEEEVMEIVQTFNDVCERPNKPHQIKNWFEQFKKK